MRDSKNPDAAPLTFPEETRAEFMGVIKWSPLR
ncbi:DUF397 domain-containing protein [Bailinhaonella thermotolerans]|nr:DUF397 domain-containing protein [Bailinhaonella thermotolerans]